MAVAKKKTTGKTAKQKAATKKTAAKKAVAKKAAAKKTAVKKTAAKKKTTTAQKSTAQKSTAKKTTSKKSVKKATEKQGTVSSKKSSTRKTSSKKTSTTPKKTAQKKAVTKKAAAQKPAAAKKKSTTVKPAAERGSKLEVGGFVPYKEKKGEEYMNPRQMAHFRAILENWKKELLEEMERTVHHLQDEAANFPDPNDRASQESEFALELRTRDRERKLIKKIDESLAKIDSLDYGYCEVCGVEIGIRRLEARPTATLCIDCKTLDEIREKQSLG